MNAVGIPLETGISALLFAAIFLRSDRFKPLQRTGRHTRAMASLGAGMSAAYVFMRLMPELQEARSSFVDAVSVPLRYEGMAIYFLALLGFLVFYELDQARKKLQVATVTGEAGPEFRLQISGFAAYVWLMSYLLVHQLGSDETSTAMYTLAMAFHFLALDCTLHEKHGEAYRQTGRFVLATAAIVGWASGLLYAFPQHTLALLVAFLSGAIIMTSTVMELAESEGPRYLPFLVGGVSYGLVLMVSSV